MDPPDLRLLVELEGGLPLVAEPYAEIGRRLGISGDEVLERIAALKAAGVIRRLRARIDQRRAGIAANALVAWRPPPSDNGGTGAQLAAFPCVTHCYERRPVPGKWEYTLYTVHHGYSRAGVCEEIQRLSKAVGVNEYVVLFSTEEFKRVPNVRVRENGGIVP